MNSNELSEIEALKTHPVKEHFEDEPQAEELHEILQSNAELTDEEIISEWIANERNYYNFARAIMKRCGIISGTDK